MECPYCRSELGVDYTKIRGHRLSCDPKGIGYIE